MTKIEKTGLNISGSGYKVFSKKYTGCVGELLYGKGIASPFWPKPHGKYDLGKWVKDNNTSPRVGYNKYKPGFHIFTEYPTDGIWHTPWYTIKRVKFRGGHTVGEDFGKKTVVCKEMKIKKFSLKVVLNKFRRWLEEQNGI